MKDEPNDFEQMLEPDRRSHKWESQSPTFLDGTTSLEDHQRLKAEYHHLPRGHEQAYTDAELEYAVTLIRAAYPYLNDLVGIASSMRVLVPLVEEFLLHHGGLE